MAGVKEPRVSVTKAAAEEKASSAEAATEKESQDEQRGSRSKKQTSAKEDAGPRQSKDLPTKMKDVLAREAAGLVAAPRTALLTDDSQKKKKKGRSSTASEESGTKKKAKDKLRKSRGEKSDSVETDEETDTKEPADGDEDIAVENESDGASLVPGESVQSETSDDDNVEKEKKRKSEEKSDVEKAAVKSEKELADSLEQKTAAALSAVKQKQTNMASIGGEADLKSKLSDAGSNLVVIDFFAKWCGPCKMISPKIEELAREYPDVVFLKVDVDECEEIATEYDILSMPTFVFIKNNAKVETFSGANFDKLKETVLKHK